MIPSSHRFDQSSIASQIDCNDVVLEARTLFSAFDWSVVQRWQEKRSRRGRPAHPESAYLKALLLRIQQQFSTTTRLRHFLLTNPLLIIDLGFHLVLDPSRPYGFDPDRTLPCDSWFRHKLRSCDPDLLRDLLNATVRDLKAESPGLGEVVSFDVKHIYAWVKENNERAWVANRYDKTRRPVGDPDCKLGVKRSSNQEHADGTTTEKKELIWGYGSGVAAAISPDYGDVVIAEYTQPFNENDVTYFRPLAQRATLALDAFPTNSTADAAFDAWYVYQFVAPRGAIAAIPLNQHGHPTFQRDADGVPLCPIGLRMLPTFTYRHTDGYHAQRYRCPLLHPQPTGDWCDHEQFKKGCGCVKNINIEQGGLMRVTLDRTSEQYQAIYRQRTAAERINSQAKELGIERPKVRNRRSVATLNTLTYLIINARALSRAKSINNRSL